MKSLLFLLLPLLAVATPIPKKKTTKQLYVREETCLKYSANAKECAPVELDFGQLQDVVLHNPNSLTCTSYQFEVVSATGGVCTVGGSGGTTTGGDTEQTFIGLADTPSSWGDAGQLVFVSGGRDQLEFGNLGFTQLNDTPSSIMANGWVRGNADGTALIFSTSGPTSGGTPQSVYLGASQVVSFQIPATSGMFSSEPGPHPNTRADSILLTSATANVPVFYNVPTFSGAGVTGVLTQSVVSGIGRVTVGRSGYANIVIEDEVYFISSTAGSSGNVGELVWVLTQYGSDGTDKRSWVGEHPIEDPVSSGEGIKFPFSLSTGLTPVEQGDYFTFNFAFAASKVNDNVLFQLPADNPGLDERVEFIFFPSLSVVPTGPAGPAGPAGPRGPPGQDAEGADSTLIALPTTPTDLTPYSHGQILAIETPSPGKFLEVLGADANERHSFRTEFAADSANPAMASWTVGTDLNYGYSSFGDVFGALYTADGGRPFTASDAPVMRMEIEQEVATLTTNPGGRVDASFNTTYTLLIRKTDLTSAPATIFARYYTGPPASNNQVTTVEFTKGSDNPLHDYHTYIDNNGAEIDTDDILSIKYFSLFTSSPRTDDQTSNPLQLHDSKSTRDFTAEPAAWARAGQPTPQGTVNFTEDEADTSKSLKLIAEETTPPGPPGAPTAAPSDLTFVHQPSQNRYSNSILVSPFFTLLGSRSLTSNVLLALYFHTFNNRYQAYLKVAGRGQYAPIAIIIDGSSYNFNVGLNADQQSIYGGEQYVIKNTPIIPTNDRVNDSDLTKAVNFEFVKGETVTFSRINSGLYGATSKDNISLRYVTIRRFESISQRTLEANTLVIGYTGSKTIADIIINGISQQRSSSNDSGTWTYPIGTGSYGSVNRISATNLTLSFNLRFTDGSYLFNDRFHLFQTTPSATPETKVQKVLTRAGVLDWLNRSEDGTAINTPRRVTTLPADSTGKERERVFLEADYTHTNGVDITPENFFNTEIGGEGYGSRGWYSYPALNYDVGRLSPKDSELADIYLISDTVVLIKAGQLTNLSHIVYGDTECALVRNTSPQAISGPDQRQINVWMIAAGCSPAGDWDNVRFKTSANAYIPASVTVPKGLYQFINSDWAEAGFYAPSAETPKDFKVAVEVDQPGARQDKNLPFVASGSTQTTTNPFPGVLRITYNNLSTDTDTYQRYTVFVPLDGFLDEKAPSVLDTGSVMYSLSYFETDAGQAVYRTAKVKSTEAQTSAGTRNGMNVGFLDGSWAGQSGEKKALRTYSKSQLVAITNSAPGVHSLPSVAHEGQRVELLNDITIHGGAVLTAQESAGTSSQGVNISGLFTGYEIDSSYDNGSTGGDLGSLNPANANFQGLVSFSNAHAAGNQANKTMFIRATGSYTPVAIWINGKRYAVGSLTDRHFYPLTGLDGTFLKAGKKYYVNAESATGRLYGDVTYNAGDILSYTGTHWIKEAAGLNQAQVDARINSKVPKQFRSDAETAGQLFQPKCFWFGSATQLAAVTKEADCLYFTEAESQ